MLVKSSAEMAKNMVISSANVPKNVVKGSVEMAKNMVISSFKYYACNTYSCAQKKDDRQFVEMEGRPGQKMPVDHGCKTGGQDLHGQ
jgi:hypothetical protein